jgi:two-component system nitrate/nitrite response regulator NarL
MSVRGHPVIIAYTSRLFSDGLESIIEEFDHFHVINSLPVGAGLWSLLGNNELPEVLILEMNHPGNGDLNFIKSLTASFPPIKILLISNIPNSKLTGDLLDSGIMGYLIKSCAGKDLLTALHKMSENKHYFCSDITKTLLTSNHIHQKTQDYILTEREIEILKMLVQNQTNKKIAEELDISENTVKTHRRNIHHKFGTSNLLGMVRYACRENLVDFGCEEFCTACPYVN